MGRILKLFVCVFVVFCFFFIQVLMTLNTMSSREYRLAMNNEGSPVPHKTKTLKLNGTVQKADKRRLITKASNKWRKHLKAH